MDFSDRVAIITGADSLRGFGRATAEFMARRGCNVVLSGLISHGIQENVGNIKSMGFNAVGIEADITKTDDVKNMVEKTIHEFGKIDILVNNAGVTQRMTIFDMTIGDWNKSLESNLTGAFICSHAVLPYMKEKHYGRIIHVTSIAARKGGGHIGGGHYATAKAGIIGLSKALALEAASYGITSNCVVPGSSQTDIGGIKFEDKTVPAGVPMGRRGETIEVASAIAYLATDYAGFITGASLDINGGAYMP
ncbi:MAG: SDR family NAD(P)-dependent oxidoreductase [Flavisolibacter sp.]